MKFKYIICISLFILGAETQDVNLDEFAENENIEEEN